MAVTIDGNGLVLGRAASAIASRILHGEQINVVNAENMIVSGNADATYSKYKQRRNLKNKAKPEQAPFYPKRPDLFVKRTVRGMLPWQTDRGRDAYRRLRVYLGVPVDLRGAKLESLPAAAKKLSGRYTTVKEICAYVGWGE